VDAVVLADADADVDADVDADAAADVVRDTVADGDDDAGGLEPHPLSATAQVNVTAAMDERLAQERLAVRGTGAVWRDRV
jgi:hypothetical protein